MSVKPTLLSVPHPPNSCLSPSQRHLCSGASRLFSQPSQPLEVSKLSCSLRLSLICHSSANPWGPPWPHRSSWDTETFHTLPLAGPSFSRSPPRAGHLAPLISRVLLSVPLNTLFSPLPLLVWCISVLGWPARSTTDWVASNNRNLFSGDRKSKIKLSHGLRSLCGLQGRIRSLPLAASGGCSFLGFWSYPSSLCLRLYTAVFCLLPSPCAFLL